MSRLTVAALLTIALLCAVSAFAQTETPKVQVFGGYSLLHADTSGVSSTTLDDLFSVSPGTFSLKSNYSGWNAEAQFNANRWLGVAADVSGHYGTPVTASGVTGIVGLPSARAYSFLFGPVLSYRTDKFTPFVHALFGANRVSTDSFNVLGLTIPSTNLSNTAFAMAFGGGADVNLTNHFAVRLGQLDYLYTRHDLNSLANSVLGAGLFTGLPTHQNNLRFSTGIVINFGK